jgi:hypothetical protein
MQVFVWMALGVSRTVALCPKMVWREIGPETHMKVDSKIFFLRESESNYVFFVLSADGESEIASIEAADQILGSRVQGDRKCPGFLPMTDDTLTMVL